MYVYVYIYMHKHALLQAQTGALYKSPISLIPNDLLEMCV